MKRKHFILALVAMLSSFSMTTYAQNVAKVGNTEYATIDEAIVAWTNNTTLTLLADVTLSDVVTLSSQEHHYLTLGTHTMTAAPNKNAIEIKSYGRSDRSESGALTITADATNPGGINAGSKACIYYKYDVTLANNLYDRPIIYIMGGVFTGSSYSGISSTGDNSAQDKCATFNISGGIFNCGVSLTKTKLITSGGTFNGSLSCTGGSTSSRLISGGTFKSFLFMTADSNNTKFWIGTSMGNSNVGVHVDDEGYLCVGGPVITELSPKYKAVASNATKWSPYLAYSSAATNGLYYTDADAAIKKHGEANVTVYEHADAAKELDNNAAVKNFTPELPEEVKTFEVEAIAIEATAEATTKVTFNVEPKNANGQKVSNPSDEITFRLPVPAAWSGKANVYHEGTLLGAYPIKEENGAKFVEVKSDSFSEFAVEAIVPLFAGEGTEASPYIIDSADKLAALRNEVNGGEAFAGVYFKLTSGITLSGEWTAIGNGSRSSKSYTGNAFKGVFDGGNNTISGLTITSTTAADAAIGLFGVVDGGTVKNLNLTNVNINVPSSNLAGAAIGMMLNKATADNITVSGAIVGNDGVGGIVGRMIINGTIANCTNNASVTTSYGGIGGIVGKPYYDNASDTSDFATITNCINNGTITAGSYAGGIAGLARANVTGCVNNGEIKGGTQTGGIIGQLIAAGNISGNENKGKVSGTNHVGGIIGSYTQTSAYSYYNVTIANNINRGEIAATQQCAAILGVNNIDGFTAMTATGNLSYYYSEGLELFGNPEDMVIDATNKFVVPVAQVGENTYSTLALAVAAVEDGGTITLIANETFTENNRYNNGGWWDGLGYSGDKSFTIDLANFTISQDGALNDYLMWFKNDGAKANTITLKNGTLDAGTTAYSALATASSNAQKITVNLENIKVINNNSNGATLKIRGGSELNVKAGTEITGKDSYLGIECWAATVNIYEGAEIYQNGTSSSWGCLVGASGNGTVNVYGGKGQSARGGFIAMTSGGTINIEGGEWTANSDGTYADDNKGVLIAQSDKQYNAGAGNSIVNVTGGTFKGGYNCYGNAAGDAQINIKGGNFNANPTSYVAEDYIAVENNGVWTVELAAAKIGTTAYATLDEAIAAAQAGETVTLLANLTMSEILVLDKAITLDGNNKTLTSTAGRAINVSGADGVTIKNLTINASGERAINVIQNATNVTIDNVTATAANYTVNVAASAPAAVVAIKNSTLNGLCTVNVAAAGADVTIDNSTVNCNDNNTTVGESYAALSLNKDAVGGSIVATNTTVNVAAGSDSEKGRNGAENGTVTINGSTEGVTVTVAVITYEGSAYYYSFATLAEAIEYAKAGDVVTLIRDVTVAEKITIAKSITLDGNGKTLTYTGNGTSARAIDVPAADGVKLEVTIKNLTVDCTSSYCQRGINYNEDGKLTLEGVTVKGTNVTYALNLPGSSDNAEVTINNSSLTGNIALNVWGENSTINATNSEFVSVDKSTAEGYVAISLNNDGAGNAATGSVVTINGGKIIARDDKGEPSTAVRVETVATVNVSEETEVVGSIKRDVAIVTYEGSTDFYSFDNLQSAINKAIESKGTVVLLADVTIDELVKIEKDITIDLNGKKVTSRAKKAFEVYANTTIKNGTIEAAQRCVDTRKAVELTLTDVTLIADEYTTHGNPQPLTIGGSENGTKVVMTNVDISAAAGYGIITFVETELTATNSTIGGYNALYVKPGSDNSTFNFVDSELSGSTVSNDVEGNSFSTIAVRANNVAVNVDAGSTVIANGNYSFAISFIGGSENTTTGSSVTVAGDITGNILDEPNGNTVKVKAEYADELAAAGYATIEVGNGLVAAFKPVAKIGDTYYATLAEAIAASTPNGFGATVTLLKDITLEGGYADASEGLRIEKSVTIDGAGHTIDCGIFTKGIRIYQNGDKASNVMFKNINIVNNNYQGRCIDTRSGKINLQLNGGVNLTAHGTNSQPLTIGGSETMTKVTISGGTIDAGTSGYAVICFVPVTNHINVQGNAVIKGLAAFYLKEGVTNTAIKLSQSTSIGTNKYAAASGDFGAIVIEGSNNAVRLEHSGAVVKAVAADGAEMAAQAAFRLRGNNNTVGYYNNADAQVVTEGGQAYWTLSDADVTGTKYERNGVEMLLEAETCGYQFITVEDALRYAKNGDTVKLLANAELDETYVNEKSLTLDLNGKTINVGWDNEADQKHIYAIDNKGNLVIEGNGTINARGIHNYGELTLNGATINAIDANGGYVRNYEGATFTMEAGTIATTYEDGDLPGNGYDATTVQVDEGAEFIMNGGEIKNISNFTCAILNYGTTTVKNGKVSSVHSTLANHGTMTIDGGEFTCNGLEGITAHALWAAAGETTINGGTFDGKDNYNGFNVDASEGAVVNITGGTFLPVHSGSLYGEGTIAVSGGTFFDEVADERCAKGFICQKNEDGTYGVIVDPNYIEEFIIDDAEAEDYTFDSEKTVGTLTYKRTLVEDAWNPLYVPFALPMSELIDNYDVAYYNDVHAFDDDNDGTYERTTIELIKIADPDKVLKASYPLIIRPKSADVKNLELTLTDVTLSKAIENKICMKSASHDFEIMGTYTKRESLVYTESVTQYALGREEATGLPKWITTTKSLNPYRLILTVTSRGNVDLPFQAISMRIVGEETEDGTTFIYDVEMDSEQTVNYIYDLQGRRVLEPQKGGLYIVNGKKVLF